MYHNLDKYYCVSKAGVSINDFYMNYSIDRSEMQIKQKSSHNIFLPVLLKLPKFFYHRLGRRISFRHHCPTEHSTVQTELCSVSVFLQFQPAERVPSHHGVSHRVTHAMHTLTFMASKNLLALPLLHSIHIPKVLYVLVIFKYPLTHKI